MGCCRMKMWPKVAVALNSHRLTATLAAKSGTVTQTQGSSALLDAVSWNEALWLWAACWHQGYFRSLAEQHVILCLPSPEQAIQITASSQPGAAKSKVVPQSFRSFWGWVCGSKPVLKLWFSFQELKLSVEYLWDKGRVKSRLGARWV